ncbi:hypothetical protein [Arthrobacter sp. AQ5-05]|uniref:hypothetical protein n=1 Tax=Arthrobacter sp. AQ5-05 TaxID=2184581 RepID=UPI0018A6D593|nr:hypothetical protein [Arthrobacter sp. AQ5-05]
MTFHDTKEKNQSTAPIDVHDHVWEQESAHTTSIGQVLYMKCAAGCGARRVDTISPNDGSRSILSKEVNRRC